MSRAAPAMLALVTVSALVACSPEPEAPQPAEATADAPVARAEDVKSFELGDFTAVALRDGALEFPNDNKIFGVGRTPAEVAAVLAEAGLRTDKLGLGLQPLLVKTADRVLLFDTGAGANMGPNGGALPASLEAAHIDAEAVTDVFVSHAHGDHVGGFLTAEARPAFPNAAIHISTPEWAHLKAMSAEDAAGAGITRHAALVAAMTPGAAEFAPGAGIVPGVVRAVEIRGHTPGHSGFLITSGESSLLYVGDAVHHFAVSLRKPEWTVDFDADPATAKAGRSDLLARLAADEQRVYAVHFPFPGLGRVERRGEGFGWVPEE